MKWQKLRIGEKVKTPKGVGYVTDVRTWRQVVLSMSDAEAKLFTSEVKYRIGCKGGDHKGYQKVMVIVGKRAVWSDNMETKRVG